MMTQLSRPLVGEQFCSEADRELTVRKTSLFYPGDGFVAYDHGTGDLVFRVDTYARTPALADELVLMDPLGHAILTLRRKWPSLHQRWEAYIGERTDGQKPIFTVRRSSIFGGDRASITIEVPDSSAGTESEYKIEGSFAQRCCKLVHSQEQQESALFEIKRKVDESAKVVLGRDVFSLCLRPNCDAAFAMGVVIVLDQISDDGEGAAEDSVNSAKVVPVENGAEFEVGQAL